MKTGTKAEDSSAFLFMKGNSVEERVQVRRGRDESEI